MYENKEVDWLSKEKRELFGKSVNSIIMNSKEPKLETIIKNAKEVVDKAFKFYPDKNSPEAVKEIIGGCEAEANKKNIEEWQTNYNKDCEKAEIKEALNEAGEKIPIIEV